VKNKKTARKEIVKADMGRIPKARRVVMNVEEGTKQFTLAQADTARLALISGGVRRSTAQQYASRMRVLKAWRRARRLREITKDSFVLFLADARSQGLADPGGFRAALLHEQYKAGVEPWANEQALVLATRRDREIPQQEKGVITEDMFAQLRECAPKDKESQMALILLKTARLRISELLRLRTGDLQPDEHGRPVVFVRSEKRQGVQRTYLKPIIGSEKEVKEVWQWHRKALKLL
jgi:integrase